MVSLRPLDASDRQAVEALRVAPGQERFVSSVAESLQEAAEHPGARALCWAVHADDTPVGFVMIADEVDGRTTSRTTSGSSSSTSATSVGGSAPPRST
jgi:diamine N-acetyltransferase